MYIIIYNKCFNVKNILSRLFKDVFEQRMLNMINNDKILESHKKTRKIVSKNLILFYYLRYF